MYDFKQFKMSFLNKLCLILLFGVYCEAQMPTRKEAYMTVPRLVKAAGYPVEKHRVTTPDGYSLLMYRIPAGRRSANRTGERNAKGKKAVIILHGLGGGSSNFVIRGPEKSLGYFLADAGYDVWLSNLRGTKPTKHMNLTRNDEKFWEYSFHEQGKYDVPVMIDRILEVTGLEKIMCIGHSLGTTIVFAMLAQRPEYNDKLVAFMALAPSVYLDHLKDIVHMVFNVLQFPRLLRATGWYGLMPQMAHFAQANICNMNNPEIDICMIILNGVFGENVEQIETEMLPTFFYRVEPLSLTSLEHYAKISMTGVFTTYSGSFSSPIIPYNMSNVKIPVSLFYGQNDRFIDMAQITRLQKELGANGVLQDVGPVLWQDFNHIDFIAAKDAVTLFNKPLIKHMDQLYNKYSPE